MKKLLLASLDCLFVGLFLVFVVPPVAAMPIWGTDASSALVGSRSTSAGDGLMSAPDDGTWAGGEFWVSWNVTELTAGGQTLWQYDYTINAPDRGALSGWLLEFTETDSAIKFYDGDGNLLSGGDDDIREYGEAKEGRLFTQYSGANDLPGDSSLFGLKLGNSSSVSFISDLEPVWGVAYWADGSVGKEGWTNALNYDDYRIRDKGLTTKDFIVRPDGGVPIPEPATMLLLGAGLVGLVGVGRKQLFKRG